MLRRRRAVRQSPNGGLYGGVSIVLADGQNPMRRLGGKRENVWLHSERRMAAVRYHDHQIGALDRAARALHAAVSMSRSSTPPTTAFSSTVSRVVPGRSVTMARS